MKILIIGHGRLAKHLIHWCLLLQKDIQRWSRAHQQAFNQPLSHAINLQDIDYIWLAISDKALIPFYEETLAPILTTQKVVHFSGTVQHKNMIAAHPLMTFSHKMYDLTTYQQIHFALTGADTLSEALPYFSNPFFKLNAEHKELYHALCVVAGNLPQILWSKTQPLFADLKIPAPAMKIYLEKSLQNFFELGSQALTGPIVRGDTITIEKNLAALATTNPELKHIYESFLKG